MGAPRWWTYPDPHPGADLAATTFLRRYGDAGARLWTRRKIPAALKAGFRRERERQRREDA